MNKKIKIIELLNKIANGEYPKKIKYDNQIYEYKSIVQGTGYVTENYDWFNSNMFVDSKEDLNSYVEILEDNTEEIEELIPLCVDEHGFIHTMSGAWKGRKLDVAFTDKINELVEAINVIRKDKSK